MVDWHTDGCLLLPWNARTARWVKAAAAEVDRMTLTPRRHGGTWFVGVDALSNADDGSVNGVPLLGRWTDFISAPAHWHRAQVSAVFPGYPAQDADESDAAHRFRRRRDAAHLDGLLPEGAARRRHLREPHGFILGLPLTDIAASPLVVWKGSHRIMGAALKDALMGVRPERYGDVDLTDAYHAARKQVFEHCERIELSARRGEATLLHRHVIHGVAPWTGEADEARIIAYFRPLIDPAHWL